MSSIQNNLAQLRERCGLSAAQLAKLVGISRQTVYAMEAGSYLPNTAVALKLARAVDATVEGLFSLGDEEPVSEVRENVVLLPGSETPHPGQPVQLCAVNRRVIASAPSPLRWYFPASDAVVSGKQAPGGKTNVQVFHAGDDFRKRVLIAGCDPGISVLARHVQAAGIELVLAHRNSSQALRLLKDGCIHVAGTHLRDEASGESNIPAIGRMFSKRSIAVITFAEWEEGIVTARDNPKGIRGIEDFARKDVTIVNREAGAGSRILLDSHLRRLKVPARLVRGYERTAPGHLPAAWQVSTGAADCCIATGAAARLFGLGFRPLVSERYDLAFRKSHLELPGMQVLLDTLARSRFRRELESLGGYDARAAGESRL